MSQSENSFALDKELCKLNIKPSRNLDNLLTAFNDFRADIQKFKEKEREARKERNQKAKLALDKTRGNKHYATYSEHFDLGPFEHFFFYLILDNVKTLLKVERQKKVLEKLAINQVNLSPRCFSIIVINDSLVQEVAIFGSNTNVFDEYLFFYFYFSPMTEPQLRRIMHDLLE